MIRFAVLGCVFVLGQMVSALNLYPAHIAERVAQAKGISAPCLAAINSSIACDEALFGQTPSPDQYLWHADDLITLCSSTCTNSLQNWQSAVESACSGQTMFHAGQIMEPKMLTMLYISGYDLICLKSSQNGWCMLEEQAWQGSKIRRYPRDYCATRDPEFDGEECFTEGFQQTLVEPEDERLINLYPSEMLCSDCFVKVMHRRLSSPLLISSDFNDYLVEQFHDIEQFCTTSIPLTTATRTYYKGTMTPDATTATPAPSVTTCAGPFVQAGDIGCESLSLLYSVPEGSLRVVTGDYGCKSEEFLCFPQPCELSEVEYGDTCESLASRFSTIEDPVSLTQFMSWNQGLLGHCGHVFHLQKVCKGPPGGKFIPGGPIFAPTTIGEYYSTATPIQPTPTGTTESCGKYHYVQSGDTCNGIALRYGISFTVLRDLNLLLNEGCTNLWIGYAYCVASVTEPEVSSDGSCGPGHGMRTCSGSTFGACCSRFGSCGDGSDFCGAGNCFSGACEDPNPEITEDGTCGPDNNNWLCGDSVFGKCCSTSGFCGNSPAHCGPGNCVSGACDPDEGGSSVDGSCGPNFAGNKVCTGTQFGACCSIHGYCGDGSGYCASGNCHSGACDE